MLSFGSKRRNQERPTRTFLALCCVVWLICLSKLVQVIVG